jgi:hypothetical protein
MNNEEQLSPHKPVLMRKCDQSDRVFAVRGMAAADVAGGSKVRL